MSYQQHPSQPAYYAPVPQQVNPADSIGSWMLTQFIVGIPVVGFIYLLVVAFGGSTSVSKKNWAIATLIWMAIGIALAIVAVVIMLTAGVSLWGAFSNLPSSTN